MKKIIIFMIALILFTGCGNKLLNTPTKKVEMFFEKYQSLDDDVINQLKDVTDNEIAFTDVQRQKYIDIMKNHYQSLKYKIKDEKIDGDMAIVTVEIEVMDYSKILGDAEIYLSEHREEFYNEKGEYDITLYNDYRLDKLKEADEKVKYTIDMTLTKIDGEWVLDDASNNVRDKIQGIYKH